MLEKKPKKQKICFKVFLIFAINILKLINVSHICKIVKFYNALERSNISELRCSNNLEEVNHLILSFSLEIVPIVDPLSEPYLCCFVINVAHFKV